MWSVGTQHIIHFPLFNVLIASFKFSLVQDLVKRHSKLSQCGTMIQIVDEEKIIQPVRKQKPSSCKLHIYIFIVTQNIFK